MIITFWVPPLKIVCMIVGEYEQRAVYKGYDVVGNGPVIVLETSGAFMC